MDQAEAASGKGRNTKEKELLHDEEIQGGNCSLLRILAPLKWVFPMVEGI